MSGVGLDVRREQRRADRLADREQDRMDRNAAAAAEREARRIERQEDRADRAARRAEKHANKVERGRRRAERRTWIVQNGALLCTGLVMACAIVPAVTSQFLALNTAGLGPLLAALLAAMLEGGAWAATLGAATAARLGRPTGRYRFATWACAVVAAAINLWHGTQDYGLWLGLVLAAASLFAVAMWELHLHGAHAPTREELQRRRHARRRRRHHRRVCRTADRLISTAPYGTYDAEDAFVAAWRIHHGTSTPGLTPKLVAAQLSSQTRLGRTIRSANATAPHRLTARLWTAVDQPVPVVGPCVPLRAPVPPFQRSQGPFPSGPEHPETSGNTLRPQESLLPRGLVNRLPEVRDLAAELAARNRKLSASAIAERLRIRRTDAIALRDLFNGLPLASAEAGR